MYKKNLSSLNTLKQGGCPMTKTCENEALSPTQDQFSNHARRIYKRFKT